MSVKFAGVELIPVREAHRFDEAALVRYLDEHFDGRGAGLKVSQFEGGQSNPTFLLETADGIYVMRKKPPGTLLPSAHAVDREFRVLSALRDSEVPVPETRLFCADESVIGTPFYVMQWVPGRVLTDPLLPGLPAEERHALYLHFAEVMAALHTVDYAAVGLADFGRAGNYYARQLARWSKQYKASETEHIEAMERLIEWLPANIPADDETAVVHGDFRLGNCIVHASEPRIVAVLDWELSTLGHPLGDLAYACMGYHADTGHTGSFLDVDFDATGIPSEAAFTRHYCRHAGREALPDWTYHVAFALFRMAAIVQGVYKRGLDGIAASARATGFKDVCRLRAEQAWRLLREAGS